MEGRALEGRMTGRIVRLCCAVVLLSAPACTKKALQEIDAGGSGIIPTGGGGVGAGNSGGTIDGGSATDVGVTGVGGAGSGGGSVDAAWDAPFTGRRSFVVTSQISPAPAAPISHTFTLVVDTNQQTAIVGTWGDGHAETLGHNPGG